MCLHEFHIRRERTNRSERKERTIGLMQKPQKSNIYKDFLETNHAIDSCDIGISFSINDTYIKVAESILFHKLSPSLHGTMHSTPLLILG